MFFGTLLPWPGVQTLLIPRCLTIVAPDKELTIARGCATRSYLIPLQVNVGVSQPRTLPHAEPLPAEHLRSTDRGLRRSRASRALPLPRTHTEAPRGADQPPGALARLRYSPRGHAPARGPRVPSRGLALPRGPRRPAGVLRGVRVSRNRRAGNAARGGARRRSRPRHGDGALVRPRAARLLGGRRG
jgi:hypothetical protein